MKTEDGFLSEPCMLVPVSDLIHLIEERNLRGFRMSPIEARQWQSDYSDMYDRATRKLAAFNRKTVQQ